MVEPDKDKPVRAYSLHKSGSAFYEKVRRYDNHNKLVFRNHRMEKRYRIRSFKVGTVHTGQYLAAKYAEENTDIKVCTIIPGVIDTAQLNVDAEDLGITLDEVRAMYADDIAMGRIARPGEIAETALYMASDAGRKAFNGRFVTVSGGEYRVTPYYV